MIKQNNAGTAHMAKIGSLPFSHSQNLSQSQLHFLFIVQAVCGIIFALDIAVEVHATLLSGWTLEMAWHIALETLATLFLAVGAFIASRQIFILKTSADRGESQLHQLRGQFDTVLHLRFQKWGLSKSEVDVALLTIRGMTIADIASVRHTKVGTIKAQLSHIFHKAGVASRTELLATFMDELLDFGSQEKAG
jgi:DNA-binding CsgD family transcriptional regulator